jgi:hypothetical protein
MTRRSISNVDSALGFGLITRTLTGSDLGSRSGFGSSVAFGAGSWSAMHGTLVLVTNLVTDPYGQANMSRHGGLPTGPRDPGQGR